MKITKTIEKIRGFFPVPFLIILGLFSIGPILIITTNVYGTLEVVTVSFHKTVTVKGQAPRVVSCGYYYVKGKRYSAQTGHYLPIGAKFEIKYTPVISWNHNIVRIIEE